MLRDAWSCWSCSELVGNARKCSELLGAAQRCSELLELLAKGFEMIGAAGNYEEII